MKKTLLSFLLFSHSLLFCDFFSYFKKTEEQDRKKRHEIATAIRYGDLKKVQELVQDDKKLAQDLIHHAAEGPNPDIVAFLKSKGVDIEQKNYYGLTPLQYASYDFNRTKFGSMRYLIEQGADTSRQMTNITVLEHNLLALLCNYDDSQDFCEYIYMINYLISKGANLNVLWMGKPLKEYVGANYKNGHALSDSKKEQLQQFLKEKIKEQEARTEN